METNSRDATEGDVLQRVGIRRDIEVSSAHVLNYDAENFSLRINYRNQWVILANPVRYIESSHY